MNIEAQRVLVDRYEVFVYSDGTKEYRKIPLNRNMGIVNLNDMTSSMGEILLTLSYLCRDFREYKLHKCNESYIITERLSKAVKKTAEIYNIAEKSVTDKFIRGLTKFNSEENVTMEYVRDFIMNWLICLGDNNKRIKLKELLIKNANTQSDLENIILFFNNPLIDFKLKTS